jgi:membrane associated rhomboid family serine protease
MRFGNANVSHGFGSSLTRTGKKLLLIYGAIYVLELFLEHWLHKPVVSLLQLYPLASPNFQVWQLITHPLIHDPSSPITFLISCIVFYFFSGPVENAFGTKRFLALFYLSAMAGALCGLCFSVVGGFNSPFLGMMPSLLSMIVVFGLLNPDATILLMFVLPIKAKYLSYGTLIVTALTFLAKANPHGAYHLGGILFGYLYLKGIGNLLDLKMIYLKLRVWHLKKQRPDLRIVGEHDGEGGERKPTYH